MRLDDNVENVIFMLVEITAVTFMHQRKLVTINNYYSTHYITGFAITIKTAKTKE